MEGLQNGPDRTSLKRPFETFEHDLNPLPVTGPFQQDLDFNTAWDQSSIDRRDIFSGLDQNSHQDNDFTFSEGSNSHVIPTTITLPFMLDSIVEPAQEHNPIRIEAPSEICLGSIIDVKAQLKSTNFPQGRCSSTQGTTSFQRFQVAQEGNFYSLEQAGYKFAVLNKKTCSDLKAALDGRQLRVEAYVLSKELSNAFKSWQSNKSSAIITGELNLYAPREIAHEVGKVLSAAETFLQQPRFGLDGVQYYNPHYLPIPGFSETGSIETPILTIEDKSAPPLAQDATAEGQNDASGEVTDILDHSLSHRGLLHEQAADARIRSSLLPHQKEAINFINLRESGSLPASLSLWERNDTDEDEPFYQHIFSGAKRAQQSEAKGGILADDMGLGKTLVILATIAGSLGRGEEFIRTENRNLGESPTIASRATLIVAPSSLLMDSWIDEIRKHIFPGDLSFHKHHGQGRDVDAENGKLETSHIVLTTYATVAAEYCRGGSMLAKVKWFRIVLDEGHDIRNRSTKQFQAVASLAALHRWCLTGTPIQNDLEDLGALVAFLRVPILENASDFRRFITNHSPSKSKDRFSSLRKLLGTICLRRTRLLLNLPEPKPEIRKLSLTPFEKAEYDNIILECRKTIDMAVSGHRKSKLNSAVLESLLKLRIFCNNGSTNRDIRSGPTGLPLDADEALSYLEQYDQAICVYCTGPIYSINSARDTDGGIWIASCHRGHLVCRNCFPQHRVNNHICPCTSNDGAITSTPQSSGTNTPIPPVSAPIGSSLIPIENLNYTLPAQGNNTFGPQTEHQYPTKLLAFLNDIQKQTKHKSIAFSSWKKTLVLISRLLASHNIPFYCIDGSLSLSERSKILKNFRKEDSGTNILLMTLGTGAVGLNLAVASRIYLLEPQWNPSIELQAIGRALRLGQTDQVTIVRYIMKDTVEESSVLSRQVHKLNLAGGGFAKDKGGMHNDRMRSLLGMFGVNPNLEL
ncbi:SNF2 family N-terminal domain-containing protein [Tricladium varicosporioides]|nr:SNF2 family N-terminal domain-containing protein [Hymenoscyphus varicosporioides]